jgi:sugar/nucleoside kinase (ribokinase family)
MAEVKRNDYLRRVDLLAINLDEAALLAGVSAEETRPEKIAAILTEQHPALQLSITAGRNGSFSYDGNSLRKHEIAQVTAVNTAGAGDAHFAGVLVGLACGLDLHAAHEVGALIGGMAVMSPDTLNLSIALETLGEFAKKQQLSKEVTERLS